LVVLKVVTLDEKLVVLKAGNLVALSVKNKEVEMAVMSEKKMASLWVDWLV